jgi:hypothetical protein
VVIINAPPGGRAEPVPVEAAFNTEAEFPSSARVIPFSDKDLRESTKGRKRESDEEMG